MPNTEKQIGKRDNVRVYDPHQAKYVDLTAKMAAAHHANDPEAEHIAAALGEAAPGDRTAEDLRDLEPALAGPTLTAVAPDTATPPNVTGEANVAAGTRTAAGGTTRPATTGGANRG